MGLLRNLIFKGIRYSGLPFLLRELLQRNRVTIVMFHDPAPEHAAAAFAYLSKNYRVISLQAFLDARRNGRSLPPKALIITLDDGHAGNRQLLPVLKKLDIPVTIFLCAGIVGTNRHFWFKHKAPGIDTQALKLVPNGKRLERLAKTGFWPEREFPGPPQALSREQIREMQAQVDFQGHTAFHPCLPQCTDEEAREEIFRSKEILEQTFELPVNAMAFPNGDYSGRDIRLLREAGYACAITVDFGFNSLQTDACRLKRLSIDDTDNPDAVCVKASGIWTLLLHWAGRRRLHGRAEPAAQRPETTQVHQNR